MDNSQRTYPWLLWHNQLVIYCYHLTALGLLVTCKFDLIEFGGKDP